MSLIALCGDREFFEQVIRDNLDLGRPEPGATDFWSSGATEYP